MLWLAGPTITRTPYVYKYILSAIKKMQQDTKLVDSNYHSHPHGFLERHKPSFIMSFPGTRWLKHRPNLFTLTSVQEKKRTKRLIQQNTHTP